MGRLDKSGKHWTAGLIEQAGVADTLPRAGPGEEAWIEVIRKMDEVYADLVRYQIEIEEKNAALEVAQDFITSVLASMTDVLIVCDINGRIERVNAAAERLSGHSEAELVGMPLSALLTPSSALFEHFPEKLRAEAMVDCEVTMAVRDGAPAPLAVNCSPRYDHERRLAGLVVIGRPIGELRRAYRDLDHAHQRLQRTQAQLVVAEKMAALGRLVAGVAHELNNPISFVFGNMHALKRYGEHITEYLAAIDRGEDKAQLDALRARLKIDRILGDIGPLVDGTLEGAERVADIVQELRRFSSSQKEPCQSFDLVQTARTACQWVTKAARRKPEIVIDAPEQLEVTGRKGPVHQIVVNLVQNATDVMAGEPVALIELTCGRENGEAYVSVRDHGPGLRDDDTYRIFEPFFTTKPLGEGTGLGLYVSYGLAQELGGRLEVANHLEGGAIFTLTFPAEVRDE